MAFRFRYPNKGCFAGNYCCTTCIYFCFVDGRCGTPTLDSIQLCSTDGLTYTGSDPVTGASATATYSAGSGWAVSYSCPGSLGSHGWGAGNNLPLVYEDPSAAGWYVGLSSTPIACNSSGLRTDCYNCIIVTPAITRTLFATLSGWTVGGVSFDGTYALTQTGSTWNYASALIAANTAVCALCAPSVFTCYLQLNILFQCDNASHFYNWNIDVSTPSPNSPCYPAGAYPNCNTQCSKSNIGSTTLNFSSNFGACNFSLNAGSGVTFHL